MSDHDFIYTCGAELPPNVPSKFYVRDTVSCGTVIEHEYYALARRSGLDSGLCCHCGETGSPVDQNDKKVFVTVLPVCIVCSQKGLKAYVFKKKT